MRYYGVLTSPHRVSRYSLSSGNSEDREQRDTRNGDACDVACDHRLVTITHESLKSKDKRAIFKYSQVKNWTWFDAILALKIVKRGFQNYR